MPPGLGSEVEDQRPGEEAAEERNREAPVPGERERVLERVEGLREQALVDELREALGAAEGDGLDEADHDPEDDRPRGAREPAAHGHGHHEHVAFAAVGSVTDGGDRSSPGFGAGRASLLSGGRMLHHATGRSASGGAR
jgi:hypothetical protein